MRNSRKKASLQLSINAIVILILAITILGIGLGFIRSQWTNMENRLADISKEIEQQIVEKIETSGEILVFDKTRMEVQKGKTMDFFYGVKNTNGEERKFGFVVRCVQKQGSGTTDCNDDIKGGVGVSTDERWFEMFPESSIPQGTIKVMPIKLQIPNAEADTYELRLDVFVGDSSGGSPSDTAGPTSTDWVTSETFYIVLS